MKKTELREFFRDFRASLRVVSEEMPGLLPVTVLSALVDSAFPFVSIILGARILDRLLSGGEGVMTLVWWMVGLNLGLGLASKLLEQYQVTQRRKSDNLTDIAIVKKCLTMDYQQLETQEIMDKKTRAVEGSRNCGGGGGTMGFLQELTDGLEYGATIIYALLTVSRLFVRGDVAADAPVWVRALDSPWAALALLAAALGVTAVCIPLTKWVNKVDMEMYEGGIDGNRRFGAFYSLLDYPVGKDLRTYDMAGMVMDKFMRNEKTKNARFKKNYMREQMILSLIAVVNLGTVLLAYAFVGLKAMAGLITVGAVSMQVGAITAFAGAVSRGIEMLGRMDLHRKYMKEFAAFLDTPSEKYNGTLPVEKRDDGDYDLEFRDVSFRYPNQKQWSLRHVSCVLPKGRKLAIVGPNGAGKTTFIKLLCRLYDPTEGEILLNGIDIRKYDYGEYLSLLSVVFQDFKLFSMKLGENVAASVDYDPERVWACLEKAGMKERVESMAEGLETGLYQQKEDGVELSGGEGQKLALARALYKDAPVVILDEPTAALDPVSEYEIYSRFGQMVEGKTSIYISHRMSSCRFCDLVYVFDGGCITQTGAHEELLAREGLYARLWRAQARYY
ncbi:MAG: ABC transporter ATP-binding protein/permease [Oscillospiraceae bacterium]|nr:ABC transporter ATP-binding protein/permease [Oscillospiraceae bacterium]